MSAEGVWLLTRDGERVLDLYGGHAVAALGYGHPGWTRALTEQAQACNFQSNAVPMDVRSRAAERLIRFAGGDFDRVFFVNSGAEANENALKMAFRITEAHARRGGRVRLPRPHGCRRRAHLGRAAEVVRLAAHAVRCELHAAA